VNGHFGASLLAIIAATAGLAWSGATVAAEATSAETVIELFTSQGCSSCPPADALAGQLAEHKDLVVLSMPVDYWDYLGWKDTFAKHQFSERQRSYALARGDGQVYTPQMVVNGLQHAVGSEEDSVKEAIAATDAALKGKRVPVKMTMAGDGLTVDIGAAPAGASPTAANVLLADFKSSADVSINRGENGGHKVTYFHIVRQLQSVGTWTGQPLSIHLTRADLTVSGSDGCAVLLQQGSSGPILGAAQLMTQ